MKKLTLTLIIMASLLFAISYLEKFPIKSHNISCTQGKYKISACDWMMLKRQKIGSFELMKELGGDGIEMDMGSLGSKDTFDNKLRQPHFRKLFTETALKNKILVSSVAMSGFYGQSFLRHNNYRSLVEDCINTMKVMDTKVAFLPLGGIKEDWINDTEARSQLVARLHEVGEMAKKEDVVIGIRVPLVSEQYIQFLKEINSEGIKAYLNFQDVIQNGRDICAEIKALGKERICQIHCTDTDGVTLPYSVNINMKAVKNTLDEIGWKGWLVVERSRDKDDVKNVKKNFGTNITYLKSIFLNQHNH